MSSVQNKNILITGATGVLGQLICNQLESAHTLYKLKGDICDRQSVIDSIPNNLDIVIHLAAIVPTSTVDENPIRAFDVNVGGTINLITALQNQKNPPFLFYASTSHVYKSNDQQICENSTIEPVSLYGKTKHLAEAVVTSAYPSDFCIGRIFSFYHETQTGGFLYPTIKKRLAKENLNQPFDLYGADSIRDFLPAEIVCKYIALLCLKNKAGVYNIASGQPTIISDFVQQLTRKKLHINKKGKSDTLIANIDKLKAVL